MTKDIENSKNAVERRVSGGFTAVWHGQTVYEKGVSRNSKRRTPPVFIWLAVTRWARSFTKVKAALDVAALSAAASSEFMVTWTKPMPRSLLFRGFWLGPRIH